MIVAVVESLCTTPTGATVRTADGTPDGRGGARYSRHFVELPADVALNVGDRVHISVEEIESGEVAKLVEVLPPTPAPPAKPTRDVTDALLHRAARRVRSKPSSVVEDRLSATQRALAVVARETAGSPAHAAALKELVCLARQGAARP